MGQGVPYPGPERILSQVLKLAPENRAGAVTSRPLTPRPGVEWNASAPEYVGLVNETPGGSWDVFDRELRAVSRASASISIESLDRP